MDSDIKNSVVAEQYTNNQIYVPLHCHSVFSTLDGVCTPEQYADECAKRGYPAMALTEHGHMASVPDMYLAFSARNVKSIFGCEIYYNDWEPVRQDLVSRGIKIKSPDWKKEHPEENNRINRNRHLTVLCKNETGFQNLIKLTTQAYKTGLYGAGIKQFNRIWFEKLCEHKEGLIILSGCLNGPICHELRMTSLTDKDGQTIWSRDYKKCIDDAVKYVKMFKAAFGEDYYIELQMPGVENDAKVFRALVTIADQYKIKTILANDTHYLKREDFELQKIMMAIAQGVTVDSKELFHVNSDEQYFKTRGELWERFVNNPYSKGIDHQKFEDMCNNTLEIADKVKQIKFDADPKIPDITNADDQLRKMVSDALIAKGLHLDKRKFIIDGNEVTYVEQAKIELNRFIDKGFSSYFIITRDLIKFGRDQGWPFSPRGCTIPSAMVIMADGNLKQISDIETGDAIQDGFGDNQIVENKFIYDVSEELFVFDLDGTTLELTGDHKLYIIREGTVMLLPAKEILETDEIINGILN